MLTQWLMSLPKAMLVTLILGVAIFFIVAQDPPHTVCRTQIENFKQAQKGFLYKDSEVKTRKKPLMDLLIKNCKQYNSPGSCYGLFSKTRQLIRDFRLVSPDCKKVFAGLSEVKKSLFNVYSLMIRLAWGQKAPTAYQDKLGWLSKLDISLFCLIKRQALFYYGPDILNKWEQDTFKKLPGKKGHSPARLREMAIVSEDCSLYPTL